MRARGFAGMPLSEKGLFALAWMLIGLSALALRVLPFRYLAPLLGKPIGAVACVPLASDAQIERARMVRRALRRAAQLAPFRADCLPQAFAAATLCRMLRVPAAIHLGMRIEGIASELAAHAWVCAGAATVSGGNSFEHYMPVSCFLPSRLAGAQ